MGTAGRVVPEHEREDTGLFTAMTTINLDPHKIPRHIAIIMDGNGRWARKHTLGRISGHKKGAESVRVAVSTCRELGVKYLTLYAFSVENWTRPAPEVNALMDLLEEYLRSETAEMIGNNIRLETIGNIAALRNSIKDLLSDIKDKTAGNDGLVLNLALSYGGRDEVIAAVRRAMEDCQAGRITPADMTKESFADYLYTSGMPDPDLLIRTSGEYRLSNFLLWQMAYTEFYFTDVLWPDFRKDDLLKALADFQQRERRYGLTSDQLQRDYT